jgi:hypothetical protein
MIKASCIVVFLHCWTNANPHQRHPKHRHHGAFISIVLVERIAILSAANWPEFVFVVSPARRCWENKRVLQLADWQHHSLTEAQ